MTTQTTTTATTDDAKMILTAAAEMLREYSNYGEAMRKIGRGFHPDDAFGIQDGAEMADYVLTVIATLDEAPRA